MALVTFYPRANSYGTQTLTEIARAQAKQALSAQALNHQKQLNGLQLQALGAVGDQKLENAELRGQLVYGTQNYTPYAAGMAQAPYGYGGYGGYPAGITGAVQGWGIPGQVMGLPGGFPGSGQSNVTNQTATGNANQSVTNSNQFINNVMMTSGFGGGGFPFGGLIRRFMGGW